MKFLILILIIFSIKSVDVCIQMTTYNNCIGIQDEQCEWNGVKCQKSKNYLQGCSPNLSQKLCIKQLGYSDGTISECIFDGICHTVYDKYTLNCSDKLSKSGCLSITNPEQLCKWKNEKCQNLNQDEINNINTIFPTLELSSSVCSRISGYMVIHHTLLWKLFNYIPDLLLEAENLVKSESGIAVDNIIYYDDATLQDNYLLSNGTFVWYTENTKFMPYNIQLNSISRYGCIAQEILNENRFLILFNLNGIIRGINHIYCKYFSQHPTNPIHTIFINNECQIITENQLQNQDYINEKQISCQNMSGLTCQRFFKLNTYCKIDYAIEYQCYQINIKEENQICSSIEPGLATHYLCSQTIFEPCFLDNQYVKGYCNTSCYQLKTQIQCIEYTQCIWMGNNLGNITQIDYSEFYPCIPLKGCDQLGLNELFCKKIPLNCYWNNIINKCQSINNIELLKCIDCNTQYCCSSIIMQDQYCIWNQNQCINVKDSNIYSHYLSFPTTIIMNYNLCVNQIKQYNYYDYKTKTCSTNNINLQNNCVSFDDLNINTNNFECNNNTISTSNKEYCLNLINSLTKWDIINQKCLHITNTQIQCDNMILVNQNVCREALIENNQICLYDQNTFSCYSTSITTQLNCNTQGINYYQCVNIQNQNCIWIKNQCQYIYPYQIMKQRCFELQNVSQNVCRFVINQEMCQYDSTIYGCQIIFIENQLCNQFSNLYACIHTDNLCYFDNVEMQCKDSSNLLNILQCEMNITEITCLNIKTNGQRCYWGSIQQDSTQKCRQYQEEFHSECQSYIYLSNSNLCEALNSNSILQLNDNHYCEIENNECKSIITQINDSDCGYNRQINIFRCMGYTTNQCYFNNYKCNLLQGPYQYKDLLLNQLQCNQSNMQICNKITTPNQICYKYDDRKCIQLYYNYIDTCENLAILDMTHYSPQLCTKATDPCIYDKIQQKCVQPQIDELFNCNQIGASKQLCRLQTKGACVYIDYYCQNISDLSIDCELRNKMACTLGLQNCKWDSIKQMCLLSTNICPQKYTNGSAWSVCQISSSFCFAGRNGCEISSSYLPCWLSLSNVLCKFQNGFCQWINNKCTDGNYNCEDTKTIEECVLHKSKNCVYDNNQCYEVNNFLIYSCQYFQYTSESFCRNYYPQCIYSKIDYKCNKVNYVSNSYFKDIIQSQTCNQYNTLQFNCILQRYIQCMYEVGSNCYSESNNLTCPYFNLGRLPSIRFCEQQTNCKFGMTNQGLSFCYTEPLTCEQLTPDFCLFDIPNLLCYYDGNDQKCKTYIGDYSYTTIQNLYVNYELCQKVNKLDLQNSYYYQGETYLCKGTQKIILDECTMGVNLHLCTFVELQCDINFDSNQEFVSCTQSIGYNINNNLQTCTSLIDKSYFFNLNTHECEIFINQYDQIYLCQQLNQKSCLSIQTDIECVWNNNKCVKYQVSYSELQCQYRNNISCLKDNLKCIWVGDIAECQDGNSIVSLCDDGTYNHCKYSESYCISINKLWNGKECYNYTLNLPESFFRCELLGLNQNLCINNTKNLQCFWDGQKCKQANLKILNCGDKVSQNTCINILTLQQACKWQVNTCINVLNSQNCNDFITLQNCRKATIQCEYNFAKQLCEPKIQYNQICSTTLSYGACKNVEKQFCSWEEDHCEKWLISKLSCENITNKWGCMNSEMKCYWNNGCINIAQDYQTSSCLTLPNQFNKISCKHYSTDPCEFNEVTQVCDIQLISTTSNSMAADETQYLQIRLQKECTEFNNQIDCIGSRLGYCEWQNDFCLNCKTNDQCSTQSCKNKNIFQCLKQDNLYCAWRDNSCIEWIQNSKHQISALTLVTQLCCSLYNIPLKYDSNLHSCVQINQQTDNCDVDGISEQGCYKIQKYQCIYIDNKCQTYEFQQQQNCTDYINISSMVCQQLPHLSCKYDKINHKCVSIDPDFDKCNTNGLSLYGCTEISTQPCEWNIDLKQCKDFILQMNENQCDNYKYRNSQSCPLMNFFFDVCSYNTIKRTCHSQFNKYSKCSTKGLNYYACVNLVLEPCIYINSKCQKIESLTNNCIDLQNVNELACRMNTQDSCLYDQVEYKCKFTLSNLPCSQKGLNINSCNANKNCNWSSDFSLCQCNSQTKKITCLLSQSNCENSFNCIYDLELNYCRIKNCNDLESCSGTVNNKLCYLDQLNQCQNADTCEDIVNLNAQYQCQDFVIGNSNCMTSISHCISHTNLKEICSNSDCSNTSCKLDNFFCRPLQCQDYSELDCYNHNNCSIINNQCQTIQSCSYITDQTVCVSTKVNNFQCSWEYYGIYENVQHCTNTYCNLYNVASSICNGNEINEYSCFMDQFSRCKMCEEIDDQCTCENSEGACLYQNNKCNSILCQQFLNQSTCETSNKCSWSQLDNVCRKKCKFLVFEVDCEAVRYECHWNSYKLKCQQGAYSEPDLSVKISVQDISTKLLNFIFIFSIIFY